MLYFAFYVSHLINGGRFYSIETVTSQSRDTPVIISYKKVKVEKCEHQHVLHGLDGPTDYCSIHITTMVRSRAHHVAAVNLRLIFITL